MVVIVEYKCFLKCDYAEYFISYIMITKSACITHDRNFVTTTVRPNITAHLSIKCILNSLKIKH